MNHQLQKNKLSSRVTLKTQYWLFAKRKTNLLLLLAFLIAGLYGLYQGYAYKSKQVNTILAFSNEKNTKLNEMVKGFDADTTKPDGKAAYQKVTSPLSSNWYIVLPAVKQPSGTAIFSIGQADVFPYYYTVKIESFFMQLFKQGEIANPLRSLSGHFDVNFWIIYLLPLLIILLCFNTLSAELVNGNWRLINSQGITARQWISSKFLLVALLIEILLAIIFISGLCINFLCFKQSPSFNDLLFFIGVNLYMFLWLSIIYAINTIGKNTSSNALYSGIAWVTICIIMPTLITMGVEKLIPVDNTAVSRMSRRPQGSKFDDNSFGTATIKQLGETNNLYKKATIHPQSDGFPLAVYIAYHKLMDDTNTVIVNKYYTDIEQRQRLTNFSGLINPTAAIDGIFTSLAGNDAYANHQFVWQTKAFHTKLQEAYFPPLLFERLLSKKDYGKFPAFTYKQSPISINIIFNYLLLLLLSIIIVIASNRKIKHMIQ